MLVLSVMGDFFRKNSRYRISLVVLVVLEMGSVIGMFQEGMLWKN